MAQSNLPYFLLGVGVGAAWGLIFAPKAGQELREELQERGVEGRDYVRRRSEAWREQADEALTRGRSAATNQRDHLAAALEAGRRAYREAVGQEPTGETKPAAG